MMKKLFLNDRFILVVILINCAILFVDAMVSDNNDAMMHKLEEIEKKIDEMKK